MSKTPFEKDLTDLNADLQWYDTIPGAFLRRLRKDRGYSLARLETLSGVSDSEIHRVETGQQDCAIQSLVRLCAALGTTPGYILDRSMKTSRTEIHKRILADSDFGAIKKGLTFATPVGLASFEDALVCACQAFSILLRCSDPVSYRRNLQFPLAEWERGFTDFAARIAAIGEGVDRASMMHGLLTNPIRELRSQGLLPDVVLTEGGLAKLLHGAQDGFVPDAKPAPGDSYAIIEKPDGDFTLKPILPDNK